MTVRAQYSKVHVCNISIAFHFYKIKWSVKCGMPQWFCFIYTPANETFATLTVGYIICEINLKQLNFIVGNKTP